MRMHLHMPDRLVDTVGGVCAGLIIVAMLSFAIAEALAPLLRLVKP